MVGDADGDGAGSINIANTTSVTSGSQRAVLIKNSDASFSIKSSAGTTHQNINFFTNNSNNPVSIVQGGITFPLKGSSNTVNSSVLDDYEEGTYTPVMAGSSTAGSYSADTAVGYYTKVGNVVTASFNFNQITVNSAGTGGIRLSLPFVCANIAGMISTGAVRLVSIDFNSNPSTIDTYCVAVVSKNFSDMSFSVLKSGANLNTINATAIANGDGIQGSITYLTST